MCACKGTTKFILQLALLTSNLQMHSVKEVGFYICIYLRVILQSVPIKEYIWVNTSLFFLSLSFYSGDDPSEWERTFVTFKIYCHILCGKHNPAKNKPSQATCQTFLHFLPFSLQRKNVILPQLCTAVSGGANGLYHLPERGKRLKVSEDEEELYRDENTSMGLGDISLPWGCL